MAEVRLQDVPRVEPGVSDDLGRVVAGKVVRRNATSGGKHASPLPSGTLHNGSGNRGGAGDGYLMPLHTALGHVSDGCSGSGSAGALVLCMHGSMTTAEPSPYSCKSRDKRIPIQLYGTLAGLVLSLLGII